MANKLGRVLVVDDEETVRSVLQRTLEVAGYDVATAANGQEALDKVSETEVDAALLDMKMPGMSGMEVLQQLTAHHPQTCVLMVTAVDDAETAIEAMKAGAYDYIIKPFNSDDVVLKLRKATMKRDEKNKNVKEAVQRLRKEDNKAYKRSRKEAEQQAEDQAKGEAEEAQKLKETQEIKRRKDEEARKREGKEAERKAEEQVKGEAEEARKLKETQETKRRLGKDTRETMQNNGPELYSGSVQIVVSFTGDFRQVRQFQERLGQLENLEIVMSGGSSAEPSIITVSAQKPMPLIRTLNEMPMVERVYKTGEKIVVVLKASSVT
ncbi:response regulator [Chloroflexota bacterium]